MKVERKVGSPSVDSSWSPAARSKVGRGMRNGSETVLVVED
jgi:hypothetical protein